jgi:hypothetical protein
VGIRRSFDESADTHHWLPSVCAGGTAYCPLQTAKEEMSWHELISDGLELYVCIILTVEYFYGRSDSDIKSEAKRKKKAREKYHFEALNIGEGK